MMNEQISARQIRSHHERALLWASRLDSGMLDGIRAPEQFFRSYLLALCFLARFPWVAPPS